MRKHTAKDWWVIRIKEGYWRKDWLKVGKYPSLKEMENCNAIVMSIATSKGIVHRMVKITLINLWMGYLQWWWTKWGRIPWRCLHSLYRYWCLLCWVDVRFRMFSSYLLQKRIFWYVSRGWCCLLGWWKSKHSTEQVTLWVMWCMLHR